MAQAGRSPKDLLPDSSTDHKTVSKSIGGQVDGRATTDLGSFREVFRRGISGTNQNMRWKQVAHLEDEFCGPRDILDLESFAQLCDGGYRVRARSCNSKPCSSPNKQSYAQPSQPTPFLRSTCLSGTATRRTLRPCDDATN